MHAPCPKLALAYTAPICFSDIWLLAKLAIKYSRGGDFFRSQCCSWILALLLLLHLEVDN